MRIRQADTLISRISSKQNTMANSKALIVGLGHTRDIQNPATACGAWVGRR